VNKPYYANAWDRFWGIKTPRIVVEWYNEDPISDRAAEDAIIRYTNTTTSTSNNRAWSESEIRDVDLALASLQKVAGTTDVLKTTSNGVMQLHRVRSFANGAAAQNNGGTMITLSDSAFGANLRDNVFHEFGHNFHIPTSSAIWTKFMAISGWVQNPSSSAKASMYAGQNFDGTFGFGQGWYRKSNNPSEFARPYGGTNAWEDWATVWELYFRNGGSTNASNPKLAAKLTLVDQFVNLI
jgi:hypothetical protein